MKTTDKIHDDPIVSGESIYFDALDLQSIQKETTNEKKGRCRFTKYKKGTGDMKKNLINNGSIQNDNVFEPIAVINELETNKIGEKNTQNSNYKIHSTRRRKRIPDRPNESLHLWSVLKNCLGQDLTKIAMPVNFSEPLSMLQRLTEDYEYSYLLDKASKCTDSCEQMCYVAAFTVSSYATTAVRTAKPFNPLLGETYECDRMDERGWRCISEQVSHHPPTAALYCEGKSWKCWQDFTMSTKFRGNSLEIVPLGMAHLIFDGSGNHYTWRKVTTVVHNLILGKLWVDQVGEMRITNHTTGDICKLKFIPAGYFKQSKEVIATVENSNGIIKYSLAGTWDEKFCVLASKNSHKKIIKSSQQNTGESITGTETQTIWRIKPPVSGSEAYYNFGEFACELNEMEPNIAPTDSRIRPDQRFMEDGKWDEANKEKVRLEEKQRAARKVRESHSNNKLKSKTASHDEVEPTWFKRDYDPVTGTRMFRYNGDYWNCKEIQDWSRCPKIY